MDVIIGLDLADKTGICVLRKEDKALLFSDVVKLSNRDPNQRLSNLYNMLKDFLSRFKTSEMAIEDVFLPQKTSRKTPISLGELRGVARLCAVQAKVPVFFYPPTQVKLAITGSGRANKQDVISLIEQEFNLKNVDDNQADAIGIAYTHWLLSRFNSSIEAQA
ncbi:MAG: crossover junction endodeoxyribonuclease RuvC [Candidatus Riflebacteria bacterium]|nr:crossover junction endodeoxyribonuclease RuvC [Candidatus Riflebacteria bacterium]